MDAAVLPTPTKPVHLFDRSRITTDWSCPRKRFLAYEAEGKGYASAYTGLELHMGTVLHDALARIAQDFQESGGDRVDIDLIATTARQQMVNALLDATAGEIDDDARTFAHEQACLVEGLLRGFHRHVWPRMMEAFPRIVCIEQEMYYVPDERGDLKFMSRPDLVLEDNEGLLWYVEYKSTANKKAGWINSWQTAVQLHSGIKAIEQTLKRDVAGVIVQGLYKGYESYGRQNSPFCYAFVKNAQPPFILEKVQYEYAAGFQRQPVWTRPGGVAAWVAGMSEEMLADQFPQAPPIFVNHAIVDRFFEQVMYRERTIAATCEALANPEYASEHLALLDRHFPQRFDQCRTIWGRGCQFMKICHGGVTDPLTEGFVYREPHHQAEVEQDAQA